MTQPCYKYQALPQQDCIRLLILLPGNQEDSLFCRLLPVPLSEASPFEALSYVWGKREDLVEIDCGHGCQSITPSLGDALRRFRYETKERRLWADALCINQGDDAERSHQVSMMGSIYWHAERVLVWLGPDDTQYEDENGAMVHVPALGVFETIQKTAGTVVDEIEKYDSLDAMPDIQLKDLKTYDVQKWSAVALFLQRSWFHRGWVIQELGLAADSTFFCGAAELGFFDYLCFARWLIAKGRLLHNYFGIYITHQMVAIDYWFSTRTEPDNPKIRRSFLSVIASGRGVQCTDEKDYIYAFLGHPSAFERFPGDIMPYLDFEANFTQNRPTIVRPDYSKSVAEINMDFACNYIRHTGTLLTLSYISHDNEIQLDHPSWAPRWHVDRAKEVLAGAYYTASLTSSSIFRFHSSELHVRGHRIDVLEWVVPIPSDLGDRVYELVVSEQECEQEQHRSNAFKDLYNSYRYRVWQGLHKCGKATPLDLVSKKPIITTVQLSDFLFTLTAGLMDLVPAEDNSDQFHANFTASGLLNVNNMDDNRNTTIVGDASRFLLDIQRFAEDRTLFGTASDRVGLGPLITNALDECWLFSGAEVPFLLRREGHEDRYRVVGEAYIHGVMRGEAFRSGDLEDVVLC